MRGVCGSNPLVPTINLRPRSFAKGFGLFIFQLFQIIGNLMETAASGRIKRMQKPEM